MHYWQTQIPYNLTLRIIGGGGFAVYFSYRWLWTHRRRRGSHLPSPPTPPSPAGMSTQVSPSPGVWSLVSALGRGDRRPVYTGSAPGRVSLQGACPARGRGSLGSGSGRCPSAGVASALLTLHCDLVFAWRSVHLGNLAASCQLVSELSVTLSLAVASSGLWSRRSCKRTFSSALLGKVHLHHLCG